ncbi:MAG: PLP-dependent aminotransferase family protein [Anaerolineales bacterium]|nr:PLP-dependent aminotransferase family protein [Anaerolineales bacterium]
MTNSEDYITEVEDIGWEKRLARRTKGMKPSFIREILKFTARPEIISFAGGLPAPEFFPIREFGEACQHILQTNGEEALQYGPTEGYPPLKQFIAEKLSTYGILVETDNIIMTNGSQQALDLIGKLFVNPGDCMITSAPTYLGALQAWESYEAKFCSLSIDGDGMIIDDLPAILESGHDHKLIYVLPNFHNPAGTTMPIERRERLVEIAREHDLVIIEDDPYGELRYEGEYITPIFRLAPERTIYLSTFSKTLAPGIRLAYIVAPKPIIARFVQAKQGADLHTGTFIQMVVNDICQTGFLRQHVRRLREVYSQRRDMMIDAIAEHWPQESTYTLPKGGLFLWAQTPEQIMTREFIDKALKMNVAFVPGFAFYPGGVGGDHAMRLNFSYANDELINEGIYRLGKAMKEELT